MAFLFESMQMPIEPVQFFQKSVFYTIPSSFSAYFFAVVSQVAQLHPYFRHGICHENNAGKAQICSELFCQEPLQGIECAGFQVPEAAVVEQPFALAEVFALRLGQAFLGADVCVQPPLPVWREISVAEASLVVAVAIEEQFVLPGLYELFEQGLKVAVVGIVWEEEQVGLYAHCCQLPLNLALSLLEPAAVGLGVGVEHDEVAALAFKYGFTHLVCQVVEVVLAVCAQYLHLAAAIAHAAQQRAHEDILKGGLFAGFKVNARHLTSSSCALLYDNWP